MVCIPDAVLQGIQFKCNLMGIDFTVQNAEFVSKEVAKSICNYCNISTIPEDLEFVWVNMSMDYLRWAEAVKKASKDAGSEGVNINELRLTTLKEGDTSLSFAVDNDSQSGKARNAHSLSGVLDKLVFDYESQLNRFRRVVW